MPSARISQARRGVRAVSIDASLPFRHAAARSKRHGRRQIQPEEESMIKLVVAYGTPDDPAAFDRYYAETHIPLVQKIPNLRRFESGKVTGTPDGSPPPFYYLAELNFDSAEELQAS